MRVVAGFLVSFVLIVTLGMLMLPESKPKAKRNLPARSAPVTPTLDFLPGLPSFMVPRLDNTSKRDEDGWRLLETGQYGAAERAYLQVLIRNPSDQNAMRGLVTLQRLLANQDPRWLQKQAEGYRRAAAQGRITNTPYSPREMELLAEASLSASSEITAEQNLRISSLSRVSIASNPVQSGSPPRVNRPAARDPITIVHERIFQLASSQILRVSPRSATNRSGIAVGSVANLVRLHTQASTIQSAPGSTANADMPGAGDPDSPPGAGSPRVESTNKDGTTNSPAPNPGKSGGGSSPFDPQRNTGDRESSGGACLGGNCPGPTGVTSGSAGGKMSGGPGLGGSFSAAEAGPTGKDASGNKGSNDGKAGKDGKDAKADSDGKDGKNGKDGKAGKDDKDGKDSKDGKDGKDGKNGK